jgi:hypothetical protein
MPTSSTPTVRPPGWPSAGAATLLGVRIITTARAPPSRSFSPNWWTAKEPEYGEEEHHVSKADPAGEIASWDVWAEELKTVRELLLDVWNRAAQAATG